MTALLAKPWRIDRRGERIYIDAPGEVCVDICTGTPEDRARVMAMLERVQRMCLLLHGVFEEHNCHVPPQECSICGPIQECLRAAGVLNE